MASSAQRRVQPISWWWALLAGLVVAVMIVVTMWAMLAQADNLQGAARATARIDAIKTALTVGAGTGGAAALLLALRRQWLSEHTHIRQEKADAAAEFDAAERRITELYTAAAGQLGNDSASVRLAGLYALERLAQDHLGHRQTVVNVLCAYLRMPLMPALLALDPGAPDRDGGITARRNAEAKQGQELLVREAVHGILRQHLSVSPIEGGASPHPMEDHWPDIDIDLRGADLRDFDFATCRVRVANFMKATFRNGSNFACAEFTEHAYFHNATFLGGVTFRGTWFGLRTVFAETTFEGRTDFQSATFAGIAFFLNVTSDGKLTFKNARASAEFNTNWGTQRAWPEGWTERPLREGELLPDALRHGGRRTLSLAPLPSDTRWLRVVKDRHHS